MFWERFVQLCNDNNEKPSPVIKKLGIAAGLATKWKNGTMPGSAALNKIADYFNVSVDYLLGNTDIKKDPAKSEVEDGYYLLANRDGEGKGVEKLTKSEYEALVAVIKTLRNNTNEDL